MKYLSTCPVGCNKTLSQSTIHMPEGFLLECSDCGQMLSQCTQQDYISSMQEFDVAAGTKPNQSSIKRAQKLHADRLRMILQAINLKANQVKLLNVGCSSGAFLDSAKELGFNTYGVEPAKNAAQTAINQGHQVKIGFLEDINYNPHEFDAITLFEVIEHLKDPISLLKEMYRITKPGGIVMISTGNAKSLTVKFLQEQWDYFSIQNHGGHISFFNPFSIAKLAKKSGFSVYSILTRNLKLANKNKPTYRFLKILSETLSPLVKYLQKGHDMIVIMQKPSIRT